MERRHSHSGAGARLRTILVLAAVALLPRAARAEEIAVSRITSVAIDPASPGTIYVGSADGILRTADDGTTWNLVSVRRNADLVLTPYGLFDTGSGLARSLDGGATWSYPPRGGDMPSLYKVAIDSTFPYFMYAAGPPSQFDQYLCSLFHVPCGHAIYRGSGGGEVWNRPFRVGGRISTLAPAPGSYLVAYAVQQTIGFLVTRDGGRSWTAKRSEMPYEDPWSLAVSPANPDDVFALIRRRQTGAGELYLTTDGGTTWARVDAHLPTPVTAIAVEPDNSEAAWVGTSRGVFHSEDAGDTWIRRSGGLPDGAVEVIAMHPSDRRTLYAAIEGRLFRSRDAGANWSPILTASSGCTSPSSLCLAGVFRVDAFWRVPGLGTSGSGRPIPMTSNTGAFWFFQPSNLEVVLKVLDGRTINDRYWVFYGALSNVEYTITVRDTRTGEIRTYFNPANRMASVADTAAFDDPGAAASEGDASGGAGEAASLDSDPALSGESAATGCRPGPTALCLAGGRFRVEVAWRAVHLGTSGAGQTIPLTPDTGAFWFFEPTNVELVIKVLDALSFDGHFWVFYGALSDVEYTITVTDTETGEQKTYFNPQDTLASAADTSAFPLSGEEGKP